MTGDHTTPTLVGDHTYEPVPIIMSFLSNIQGKRESNNLKDDVERFDEIECAEKGLLGRFPGINAIDTILKYRDMILN